MSGPSATAIFVGGASLLPLRLKFSVTVTFTIMGTEFGNSAFLMVTIGEFPIYKDGPNPKLKLAPNT